MVSVLALAGLGVIVAIHIVIAAVLTRLFRVRLDTVWAPVVYVLVFGPVVLTVSTLVLSGVLGLGPDLGSPAAALFLLVGVPLALGLAIDYVWMPAPDEVDLPDTLTERDGRA